MFSQKEHQTYGKSPLVEVICQLRFPTILSIDTNEPTAFQEAIRSDFPQYQIRHDIPPVKMSQAPGQPPRMTQGKPVTNYQFVSADNKAHVNLTQNFISLTTPVYTGWEDFCRMMDKVLASFIQIYKPAYFERVGLRYLNAISRDALGLSGTPWRELLDPAYLGLLAKEDLTEDSFSRCGQDLEAAIPGGCRMRLHVGPGLLRRGTDTSDKEVKMILDIDVSMNGNLPVNLAAASMQTTHSQAYSIFRDAITDTLHEAIL